VGKTATAAHVQNAGWADAPEQTVDLVAAHIVPVRRNVRVRVLCDELVEELALILDEVWVAYVYGHGVEPRERRLAAAAYK
jgi:hypothetical protein